MACVVIQTPAGTVYNWPEGKPRTPIAGEKIIGVDFSCESDVDKSVGIEDILAKEGIQWGKAIKYVAQKLGKNQCSKCKAREVIFDEAQKMGWKETLKRLKETI
jgi:hypothetical protein